MIAFGLVGLLICIGVWYYNMRGMEICLAIAKRRGFTQANHDKGMRHHYTRLWAAKLALVCVGMLIVGLIGMPA